MEKKSSDVSYVEVSIAYYVSHDHDTFASVPLLEIPIEKLMTFFFVCLTSWTYGNIPSVYCSQAVFLTMLL